MKEELRSLVGEPIKGISATQVEGFRTGAHRA
jgi:hypothetical protein